MNHALDFAGCEAVFDGPVVIWKDARDACGEQRINLLDWLEGIVVHMTYTVTPNGSLERTFSGMAPCPLGRAVYHRPRGQGILPCRPGSLYVER